MRATGTLVGRQAAAQIWGSWHLSSTKGKPQQRERVDSQLWLEPDDTKVGFIRVVKCTTTPQPESTRQIHLPGPMIPHSAAL